jgi:hypothetical protein
MNKLLCFLPLMLASVACQASSYSGGGTHPAIEDKTLINVPAGQREDINKARTGRSEALDSVALAKQEVARAEERVTIAKSDVRIADSEIDAAAARLELARKSTASNRDDQIKEATAKLDGVRAHQQWARTQVQLEECRVGALEAQVKLAKQRVALADAKIELAKARAVKDLARPDDDSIDVREFERCVADEDVALKMSEIDAEAWSKKVELRQDIVETRAKAVPASYGSSWRKASEPDSKK